MAAIKAGDRVEVTTRDELSYTGAVTYAEVIGTATSLIVERDGVDDDGAAWHPQHVVAVDGGASVSKIG